MFNALEIELLATTGRDAFNAIITGAIVAQGGAALAVALKTKDPKKRSLYISSTIPAFLGITEPAIFGINLRFVKPFVYALIGGACAGACASLMIAVQLIQGRIKLRQSFTHMVCLFFWYFLSLYFIFSVN